MKIKILHNRYLSKINLVGCIFDATFEEEYYLVNGLEILALGDNYFDTDHMYRFSPEEVQKIRETFKVGDYIRLKKEFYKEDEFKSMSRSLKKSVASLVGKSFSVPEIVDNRKDFGGLLVLDANDIYILPPCIFELAEPEKKPIVEVRRVAKVGEWIKVVHAELTNNHYKNGDILQVQDVSYSASVVYVKEFCRGLYNREYVVIENYEPSKKREDVFDSLSVSFDALSKALSEHVNLVTKTRRWTPEEIVQAKCFLAGELIYEKCKFVYDHNSNRTACYNYETGKSAEAKCSPNDMFNPYIGAVVAYCKTCGVKIPEFITR